MKIDVMVDTSSVVRLASEVLRQVPYAANSAITRTAQEAAEAAQRNASEKLQIRKNFLLRRIRILHYSRASNLTAVIGVDTNVQGSPLIIGLLEEGQGGEKKGATGAGVAVPITGSPARPSFPQSVAPKLFYQRLAMEKHVTERGAIQWKGKQRTFVIPGVGIFQRVGRKQKSSRRGKAFVAAAGRALDEATQSVLIYKFKDAARLGEHVELRKTMIDTIEKRFAAIFNEELAKELRARAVHLSQK